MISFALLEQKARDAARAFVASGLQAGDRFAIWAPNIHEWIWIALGGQMAGAVLVPLNTRYKGSEAAEILTRSSSRLLFTVSGFLGCDYPALLQTANLPELKSIIVLRGSSADHPVIEQFIEYGRSLDDQLVDERIEKLDSAMLCDIMYTSGTTGVPKGVMSSHGQVVAMFEAWSAAVRLVADDRYLVVNPFFHTFGYKAGWLACLLQGACILPEAVFDAAAILETIETKGISMLPGPPTLFQSLLQHENRTKTDLTSLRCAVTGAASVPEQLVRDMKEFLGFERVYTGYGLTECGVVSICREGDDFDTIANTAGKPLAGLEVKVTDANGHRVAAGETGRISVRGHSVMQGYFNDPDATASVINTEGWLDTGDIGWQNAQGYIKVTDRASDMFISGGFNCYPAEIENRLLQHQSILDVAVVAEPDERLGEIGHAFVVWSGKAAADIDKLVRWARANMANYKVPRRFSFIDELPRNASGKVQKFKLVSQPGTTAI